MKKHFLMRVKDGRLDQWKKWCKFLVANKKKVSKTLKQENAVREAGVLFEIDGRFFVYGTNAILLSLSVPITPKSFASSFGTSSAAIVMSAFLAI